MENILDFIMAALPWLAIGLLLTIFCARSAGRKNNENHKDNYGTEGMCLGMCFEVLWTQRAHGAANAQRFVFV